MTILRTLDRFLVRIEYAFLVLILSTMILLAFAQVILRNFFDTGILWADPLVRHLVLWVGFTGAAVATHEDRHIGIDALTKLIPQRLRAIVKIFTSLFALVVCYFLGDAALTFLRDEKAAGGDLFLGIPTWVALLIIPTGYALMAFHFIVKTVEYAADVFGMKERKN